jgi:cytochrome c biogenesis protein CcdA
MMNTLRILGSVLIGLGISVLVTGCLAGITLSIIILFQNQDYAAGVGSTGIILILLGYTLRWIFNNKKNK